MVRGMGGGIAERLGGLGVGRKLRGKLSGFGVLAGCGSGIMPSMLERWLRCSSCWMRLGGGLGWLSRLEIMSGMT